VPWDRLGEDRRSGSTRYGRRFFLPLACSTARQDAPDEHGLRLAVVVEDHAPVTDAQAEVLAAREPSNVERAILGEETIEAAQTRLRIGGSRRRRSFSALRVKRGDRPALTRLEIRGLA
jgi:hypothetical protein